MTHTEPTVTLIAVWFGPLPFWMPALLLSCRANPTVRWRIYSDQPAPADTLENVAFLPLGIPEFNRRVADRLGYEAPIEPGFAYKLCDFKIFGGLLFEDDLAGVDFWGFVDLDIVWGDLRRFLTPELLANHDLITTRPGRIAGHFCLFRNAPEWNRLGLRIPRIETLLRSARCEATDEQALDALLRGYQDNRWRRWRARWRNQPLPRVYWPAELSTPGRHQRTLLEDPSRVLRWVRGRTHDADGIERMYLHFHKIRRQISPVCFDFTERPDEFTVSPAGFLSRTGGLSAVSTPPTPHEESP